MITIEQAYKPLFQSPFGESKIRKFPLSYQKHPANLLFQSPFGESKIRKPMAHFSPGDQLCFSPLSGNQKSERQGWRECKDRWIVVSVPFRGIKNQKVLCQVLESHQLLFQSPFGESKIRKQPDEYTYLREGEFQSPFGESKIRKFAIGFFLLVFACFSPLSGNQKSESVIFFISQSFFFSFSPLSGNQKSESKKIW